MQTIRRPDGRAAAPMSFFLRPMRLGDIAQVSLVERECFPRGWAPTPFKRELRKDSVLYLVACVATDPDDAHWEARAFANGSGQVAPAPVLRRLFGGAKGALAAEASPTADFSQRIVGFVGLWFIADEAHITSIGVREAYRRRGIGELLLLGSFEAALPRETRALTLEVRVSNATAQALYEKYGFNSAGVRKGYYSDDREDALIMTTDAIYEPAYLHRLEELRAAHGQRWGRSIRFLG